MLGDARFALRNLTRSPGFTAVVVVTLALGIGAATAIFSVVNTVVLQPLAYPGPDQLVRITSELRGFGALDTGVATPELFDYQLRTDLFTAVAGVVPISANVTGDGAPERVEMALVSWTYFAVLGVAPVQGRAFGPEDDTAGVGSMAIVSDAFWTRRLSADPHIVGKTIVIDEEPVQVVGVMPRGFRHPGRTLQNDVDVWSPAGFRRPPYDPSSRSRRRIEGCLARLQPGVTPEQARARLAEYGAMMSREYPAEYPARDGWMPRLVSLKEDVVGGVAGPMFILLCGVGLLLLVAGVNVAHLVLSRSSARRHEIAIRRALGATSGRLTLQVAVESALLAALGGALGVLAAAWGVRILTSLAPARVPRIDDVVIDPAALIVTGVISLAATLLFGAVSLLGVRRLEASTALKEGGRTAEGGTGRIRTVLVAAEVGIATVLLLGAGLFVRSVVGLLNVPLGFDTDHLVTARITLPRPNDMRASYLDPARRAAFSRETLSRVAALPGVEHAAMSSQIPIGGFNAPLFVELEGRDVGDTTRPVVHSFLVSAQYFDTMGIPIRRGRPLTDADRAGSDLVGVVSETAARMFWQDRDPIGQRLRFASHLPWMTVVGVAGDVLHRRLSEAPQPILYQPIDQSSGLAMALIIRTRGEVPHFAESVAREVQAVDPHVPVYAVRTMTDLIDGAVAQRRFLMRLLVAFGALATALALLGIYGVMAYSVSQRTREIAIRMAVGARQADVSRMILRRGMALTAAGMLVGIAASVWLTGLIRSQLFGVAPTDPLTMAAVLALMTMVAGAAIYLPARRAARVDPAVALRRL